MVLQLPLNANHVSVGDENDLNLTLTLVDFCAVVIAAFCKQLAFFAFTLTASVVLVLVIDRCKYHERIFMTVVRYCTVHCCRQT